MMITLVLGRGNGSGAQEAGSCLRSGGVEKVVSVSHSTLGRVCVQGVVIRVVGEGRGRGRFDGEGTRKRGGIVRGDVGYGWK